MLFRLQGHTLQAKWENNKGRVERWRWRQQKTTQYKVDNSQNNRRKCSQKNDKGNGIWWQGKCHTKNSHLRNSNQKGGYCTLTQRNQIEETITTTIEEEETKSSVGSRRIKWILTVHATGGCVIQQDSKDVLYISLLLPPVTTANNDVDDDDDDAHTLTFLCKGHTNKIYFRGPKNATFF